MARKKEISEEERKKELNKKLKKDRILINTFKVKRGHISLIENVLFQLLEDWKKENVDKEG